MDNPSQNIWLESQDGDSSLEYLHLQSVGKREPDKLGYMKPWLKKLIYLFTKKIKSQITTEFGSKAESNLEQ